ncbi:MAG: Fe-S-cluster-containing hydrogenase components 1 [Desulfotomaculum sp. 46_296]|nr:MAG: Fe-S-cluster-containing hydrogenase components 1 [Desulfotomaculum sp. 46_296]HAU31337.1 (4Fe-4S)-binding protein [Desulfotomaculum sp.]
MPKGVLVDVSRCIGCRSCQVACKSWNDLPATPTGFNNSWDNPPNLTATNWTRVGYHLIEKEGQLKWRFVKTQCMHCNEPACESACFTHSFVKTEEGAVIYKPTVLDQDYCVGCRYCMIACPFSIPKFEWDKAFPFVRKCKFCYDRMKEGDKPACVTTCPTNALQFGDREEILAEAHKRLDSNPNYIKQVYGEKEYGGTSWMYISDVPFEDLGFKTNVSEKSIPSYTWNILKWTPWIFVGWGAILTALYTYNKRRAEVHHEEEMYAPVQDEE